MAGRGEDKASERRIESAEKKRQALELRKQGVGYQAIADRLGYSSIASAHKAVQSALAAITKPAAEEVRDMEVERLDGMLFAISGQVRNGHLGAIDRALRIQERRAKLEGLDAPKESAVNVTFDVQEAAKKIAADLNIPVDVVLAETFRMVEDGAA